MLQHRTVANPGIFKALNYNPEVIIAPQKNNQVWIQQGEREKAKEVRGGEERKNRQWNKHIQCYLTTVYLK